MGKPLRVLHVSLPEIKEGILADQEEGRRSCAGVVEALSRIGHKLMLARDHAEMKHGMWLPWLERVGYDDRTARRLMQFAEWAESNRSQVSDLPPDQDKLYALTRLTTPQDVAEFLELHSAEDLNRADRKQVRLWVRAFLGLEDNEKIKQEAEAAALNPCPAIVIQQDAVVFLNSLPEQSADLLLTDPPYMTDVEDIGGFASSWTPLALSRIKPSGRAYICTGAYPDELHAYLSALKACRGFVLSNVLVWTCRNTLGPSPAMDYKLNWQAVFYLRGPDAPALDCPVMTEQFTVQDINAPDGRLGDRYHTWQKPLELAERFIRHSTRPGDIVIDPFAGTGTFLLAAASLGRRAMGSEMDRKMVDIAVMRGCHER